MAREEKGEVKKERGEDKESKKWMTCEYIQSFIMCKIDYLQQVFMFMELEQCQTCTTAPSFPIIGGMVLGEGRAGGAELVLVD